MLKINVITQLIMFMIFAIIVDQLDIKTLLVLLVIFFAILVFKKNQQFIKALKRFRWLFIVLMIIYVFNTPGEHIQGWVFYLNPTYEGVIAGLTQAIRISVVLAIISWIMTSNTKQALVSGFYFILLPLKRIGLEVDRFAARLWLTLHYVEMQNESKNKVALMDRLRNITKFESKHALTLKERKNNADFSSNDFDVIEFVMPKFQLTDYLAIAGLVLLVVRVMF